MGPVPLYNNPPIHPDWYQPRKFFIADITFGTTTLVTTSEDHDYVIGQAVRLLIPKAYGASQLNYVQGFVLSIPDTDQVEIDIVSTGFNEFLTDPFLVSITGATQANPCVLTASNNFNFIFNQYIGIQDVSGMLELNNRIFRILASDATTITIDVDASGYAAYISGGEALLLNQITTRPQILAIGDINSGVVNTSGRTNNITYIPGSFINISPN